MMRQRRLPRRAGKLSLRDNFLRVGLAASALLFAFGEGAVILDDFNRANENPANDNWHWRVGSCEVLSNRLRGVGIGGTGNIGYWITDTPDSPDVDLYTTVILVDRGSIPDGAFAGLWVRTQDPVSGGNGPSGYEMYFLIDSTGDTVVIQRWDDGSPTELDSTAIANLEGTFQLGIRANQDVISTLIDRGEGWEVVSSVQDDTYAVTGNVGVRIWNNAFIEFDDLTLGELPG
jgi:hypothetical protein